MVKAFNNTTSKKRDKLVSKSSGTAATTARAGNTASMHSELQRRRQQEAKHERRSIDGICNYSGSVACSKSCGSNDKSAPDLDDDEEEWKGQYFKMANRVSGV